MQLTWCSPSPAPPLPPGPAPLFTACFAVGIVLPVPAGLFLASLLLQGVGFCGQLPLAPPTPRGVLEPI